MKLFRLYFSIIVFIFIVCIYNSSAQVDSLPTVTMNKCINITQIDANVSSETLKSIYRPDGSLDLLNVVMTKNGTQYYYTYCKTNLLGQYIVSGCGDVGECWPYDFTVTSTGSQSNTPVYVLGIAGFLALCIALYQRNEYIGLFSSFIFIILGIYTMINGFTFLATDYTRMFSAVILGVGLSVGFSSVYEMAAEEAPRGETDDD